MFKLLIYWWIHITRCLYINITLLIHGVCDGELCAGKCAYLDGMSCRVEGEPEDLVERRLPVMSTDSGLLLDDSFLSGHVYHVQLHVQIYRKQQQQIGIAHHGTAATVAPTPAGSVRPGRWSGLLNLYVMFLHWRISRTSWSPSVFTSFFRATLISPITCVLSPETNKSDQFRHSSLFGMSRVEWSLSLIET